MNQYRLLHVTTTKYLTQSKIYALNVYFTHSSRDPRTWCHHVSKGPLALSQYGREMGRKWPHPEGVHVEAGEQGGPGWLLLDNFLLLEVNLS